jgi:hypothetical protein
MRRRHPTALQQGNQHIAAASESFVAVLRFSSRAAAARRHRVWDTATPIANGTGGLHLAVPTITGKKAPPARADRCWATGWAAARCR